MIKNSQHLLEITNLPAESAQSILAEWLSAKCRQLSDSQMKVVMDAFEKCPRPLFLKLCFDEAKHWYSYTPPEDTVLKDTVRDAIDKLFGRVETIHGKILVSKALGYLTLSKFLFNIHK